MGTMAALCWTLQGNYARGIADGVVANLRRNDRDHYDVRCKGRVNL